MGDLAHSDVWSEPRPDVLACEPASEADLALRAARLDDAFLLWFWSNDVEARRNSLDPRPIAWSAHEEGYKQLLKSRHTRVWLVEVRGVPAAQVRYSRVDSASADIHLYVLPRYRRRGIGTWLLDATVDLAGAELAVNRVRVTTLADNRACCATFLRALFSASEKKLIGGHEWLTLQRRCVFDLTNEFAVEL